MTAADRSNRPAFVPDAGSLPGQKARYQEAARLLRAGDAAGALEAFARILSRFPGSADALHGYGLALARLARTDEALRAFRSARAINPQAWPAAASIADITPDETERVEALDQCADILLDLCRRAGTSPRLFNAAAAALANAHRYTELAALARRHARKFPNMAVACDWRAKASYEQGEFGEALEWKRAALRLTPWPGPMQPRERFRPAEAWQALLDLSAIFDKCGLEFFLVAGTALGMVRSGGPLGHDRDIDIGVFRGPGPDIAGILRSHPRLMMPASARPGERYFALFHRGTAFDIFVHDEACGTVTCGVSDRPGDIQWRFSKFSLRPFEAGGRIWNLPHPSGRYLAEIYGPDWTIPDRGFASAVSSPALSGVDIRVRAFYAAARARTALLTGDTEKAASLARQSPLPVSLPPATPGN